MRIRSIKPEFWRSDDIDALDGRSWKAFGTSGPGFEFLYRLYDAEHRLLYVGITWKPVDRWRVHRRSKAWWTDVAHAEVWRCRDKDARYWERLCIKEQRPIYNIQQAAVR